MPEQIFIFLLLFVFAAYILTQILMEDSHDGE